MSWFKRNSLFFSALILLGIVLIAQIVVFFQQREKAEQMRQSFEAKIEEYQWLAEYNPSLTRENIEIARQDREHVRENLERIREALGAEADVTELFGDPPAERSDAYFDIISFAEEYREKARQVDVNDGAGVRLPSDDYMFGFSRYADRGPPNELIELVFKQRKIVAYLLDTLYEVRPVELERVARGDAAERRGIGAPAGGQGGDFFRIAPEVSARIPDFVETHEFRLVFTGYTATLREFLNRIASPEGQVPLIVRSVEVTPVEGGQAAARAEADGAVPIVASNLSRFVVTLEFIELVSPSE